MNGGQRRDAWMTAIVLAVALMLLLLAACLPARAHPWMQPGASWCCNISDCAPIPRQAVKRIKGGWHIPLVDRTFMDDDPGLYPNTHDNEFWLCGAPNAAPRCLFVPGMGA